MGIWDRSIMGGRRILPNVAEPLTEFGRNIEIEWDVTLGAAVSKMTLSADETHVFAPAQGAVQVLKIDARTGVDTVLFTDPYNIGAKVVVDPTTGDLYGVSDYRRVRWDSVTGARISQQPKLTVNAMYHGAWVGPDRWLRGWPCECASTTGELPVQWTRSPNPFASSARDGLAFLLGRESSRGVVEVIDASTGVTLGAKWSLARDINYNSNGVWASLIAPCGDNLAIASGFSAGKHAGVYALDGTVIWEVADLRTLSGGGYAHLGVMQLATDRFGDVYVVVAAREPIIMKFRGKTGELLWRSSDYGIDLSGRFDCRDIVLDAEGGMYLPFQNGTAVKISQNV